MVDFALGRTSLRFWGGDGEKALSAVLVLFVFLGGRPRGRFPDGGITTALFASKLGGTVSFIFRDFKPGTSGEEVEDMCVEAAGRAGPLVEGPQVHSPSQTGHISLSSSSPVDSIFATAPTV